jgi:hypothetical protein
VYPSVGSDDASVQIDKGQRRRREKKVAPALGACIASPLGKSSEEMKHGALRNADLALRYVDPDGLPLPQMSCSH